MTSLVPSAEAGSGSRDPGFLAAGPGPRRALVLAGGGMRVAYQAGAILALAEQGLGFELLDGASGGTLNLAMLLSGVAPEEMCSRWRTLRVTDFAALLALKEYFTAGGFPGFGGASGIRDKVFPHLGIDALKIRAASGVQGTFNVCNYTDKLNVAVPHQEVSLEHLLAGVSLPMFMPAVAYAGKQWVDSVWIKDANLSEVVRRGAEEIWLVWCIGNTASYNPGTLEQYVHMIEICANAALFAEFDWIRELNTNLEQGRGSPYGQTRPVVVHLLKPEHALPLDPEYFLGRINGDTLIGMGYADAKRYLSQASSAGTTLDLNATKMVAAARGVAFREHFGGPLEPSASEGAGPGAQVEGQMALRTALDIPSLEQFQARAAVGAALYGSVDVPGLGQNLPLFDGNFSFDETNPEERLVRFEAKFVACARTYGFRGTKRLPRASGLIPFAALERLELTLSELSDGGPRALATATLTLDGGILEALKSLRATGTQGLAAEAEAVAAFALFYGGSGCLALLKPRRPWWKFWA